MPGAFGDAILTVPVVLNGPGRVGREFIRLLEEEAGWIASNTGRRPVLCAVVSRRGILVSRSGLSLSQVLVWLGGGRVGGAGGADAEGPVLRAGEACVLPPDEYTRMLDLVAQDCPGIVVEATPTDLVTGEPGLSHMLAALGRGFSAVSLAKGALVLAFGRLRDLARSKCASLKYSGAVAAALPTVDTAVYSMAGAGITEIEGVLNGTTNFILNAMSEGKPYYLALQEAQARGVAEADPRLDVEGWDSAAKLLIIANTVWDLDMRLEEVQRSGVTELDAGYVRERFLKGTPVRLVARARMAESMVRARLTVKPEVVPASHPFANLPGTAKAVRFKSKNMGEVTVSGGASDVTGAAAAALKDVIHILEERKRR